MSTVRLQLVGMIQKKGVFRLAEKTGANKLLCFKFANYNETRGSDGKNPI
jgi:hypothetical protein